MPSPPLQSEPAWGLARGGGKGRIQRNWGPPGVLPAGEPAHKETQTL